jgi:hypothetical protein
MDNWATTDAFSVMISGWVWRENQISDSDVLNWLNLENLWWRRAAVVSTVPLNLRARGGKGDVKRTLMICEKIVADRNDMIVKALSWALRELSKSDKPAVKEFMEKYDSKLAGRVRRIGNREKKWIKQILIRRCNCANYPQFDLEFHTSENRKYFFRHVWHKVRPCLLKFPNDVKLLIVRCPVIRVFQ